MGKYKNLVSNLGLFALNAFATKLITFLLVPLYTYYLTQADFGISDMSLTVISLILPLVTLSISDAVLRFMIEDTREQSSYASTGVAVTVFSCLIVFLLLPVLDLSIFGGLGNFKTLFFIMYIINAFQNLFSSCARGLNQIKLITISSILSSLTTSLSAVFFIAFMHWNIEGYFASIILGGAIGDIIYIVFGKHYKYFRTLSMRKTATLLKKMVPYAVPLIPNALFWWIGTSINRFFITGMIGISASGLFAATLKIPNLMNMVYSIFFQAWTLSAFQEFKQKNVDAFFGIVFKLLNAMMLLAGAFITVLAPWLASLFLQKSFYDGWHLIPILVLAFYFNALGSFFGTVFTAGMQTKQILITTVISGLICAGLTWLLIPWFDIYGPAIAMVASNCVLFVSRVINSKHIIYVPVNWVLYSISVVVFIIQICVASAGMEYSILISAVIFALLFVYELRVIYPEIRKCIYLIKGSR